jgi:hypothetical protein
MISCWTPIHGHPQSLTSPWGEVKARGAAQWVMSEQFEELGWP